MTALIRYEQARHALAECHRIDDAKDIADKALALQVYARQARDLDMERWVAEIRLRARRRVGELSAALETAQGFAAPIRRSVATNTPATKREALAAAGLSKDEAHRCEQIAKVPAARFETYIATQTAAGKTVTADEVVAKTRGPHVVNNSGNNEWYTPPNFIEAARAAMGGIDVDPASSAVANRIVRAEQFYTTDDDGLRQSWEGRVWMNPPYEQPLIAQFAKAVAAKHEAGEVEQACVLVNNATETAWFQRMLNVASAVCFPRGRVRFLDPQGNPGAPLQGQAVIYMGSSRDRFTIAFEKEGPVLFCG